MKHRDLVLMLTALLVVLMVALSASIALSQEEPDAPRCDWYEAGFDRDFSSAWWAYWCRWPGYGWYLMGWWSEDTGYIPLY